MTSTRVFKGEPLPVVGQFRPDVVFTEYPRSMVIVVIVKLEGDGEYHLVGKAWIHPTDSPNLNRDAVLDLLTYLRHIASKTDADTMFGIISARLIGLSVEFHAQLTGEQLTSAD